METRLKIKDPIVDIVLHLVSTKQNECGQKRELDEFDASQLGSKKDFEKNYGEQALGKFIRSIVGLDVNAAKMRLQAFSATDN